MGWTVSWDWCLTNSNYWVCYVPMQNQNSTLIMATGWLFPKDLYMMTSTNENIFRVTGPLCGECAGHRWIPRTKVSGVELWCFLLSVPWINGWVNNREAGDWRHHCTHYDIIVMNCPNTGCVVAEEQGGWMDGWMDGWMEGGREGGRERQMGRISKYKTQIQMFRWREFSIPFSLGKWRQNLAENLRKINEIMKKRW